MESGCPYIVQSKIKKGMVFPSYPLPPPQKNRHLLKNLTLLTFILPGLKSLKIAMELYTL